MMKKHLLHLSTCAIGLILSNMALADPMVQPVRELEIPAADWGVMNIDGTADAIYSPVQTTEAFNPTGSTGSDADYTFTFQVAYDPMYLYFYGEVLDDVENIVAYTTTSEPWNYDNIEVFINLDTIGTVAAYDTNTIQLRFNRGLDSIQTPGRATQEEYGALHWENSGSGWLIEITIPWTSALGDAQVPEDMMDYLEAVHGFEVHGTDSDDSGSGHADCQTAWDMDDPDDPADRTEDNAWNNRTVFGVITLEDASWEWPNAIESAVENNLSVYPNPAVNTIHFQTEGLNTIRIYSLTGVLLKEVETIGKVDISNLKSGMYLAEINSSSFVKFIKE